jgi:glycosyltransferase involved in cell wall biosynthesis
MLKFSIIIPIFNAAETLAETLQSVKKQSFADWEIVAVNDGSTDGSNAIFKDEMADHENAIIITQENCGLGAARNTAAKNATGDWLVFLDADDFWSANKLAVLAAEIESNPEAEFVYHAIFERNPKGLLRERNFAPVESLEDFIKGGNPFVPSAAAIKKSIFNAGGAFVEDRTQVEDLLLWFRLFARKTVFLAIPKALTVYRVGHGVTANLEEHLQKVARAINQAEEEKLISAAQKATFLARKNYEAARQLHKEGKFISALCFYELLKMKDVKTKVLIVACKAGISL